MATFRTATLQDVDSLVKLINSAYRGDYSKQGWTTEADLLGGQRTDQETLKQLLKEQRNQIEVAVDETGHIIACVHVRVEPPKTLYFGMLTVEPKLQTKGLGKQLIRHVEMLTKVMALSKIRCTVIHTRAELVSFYERRGYRPTGKVEEFPMNDPKFGIPKVSEIKLLEFEKHV